MYFALYTALKIIFFWCLEFPYHQQILEEIIYMYLFTQWSMETLSIECQIKGKIVVNLGFILLINKFIHSISHKLLTYWELFFKQILAKKLFPHWTSSFWTIYGCWFQQIWTNLYRNRDFSSFTSGYRLNRFRTLIVSGYSVILSYIIWSNPFIKVGASMMVLKYEKYRPCKKIYIKNVNYI